VLGNTLAGKRDYRKNGQNDTDKHHHFHGSSPF
jgi:hypothetical protein